MNQRVWNSFKHVISELDPRSEPIVLFNTIKDWVFVNRQWLDNKSFEDYAIERKINLDGNKYPVNHSEITVSDLQRTLSSFTPSSDDSIVMFIRDVLWELLVFRPEIECPSCKDRDLAAMYDSNNNEVVLVCEVCDWIQTLDGKKLMFSKSRDLEFVSNSNLEKAGLI